MKRYFICALMMSVACWLTAQQTYFLPTVAEGVKNTERVETSPSGERVIFDVNVPSVDVYLPPTEKATGCAVILCPGGGMRLLSWTNDVERMAKLLNEQGIAAIGLKYRLNTAPMPKGMKMPEMVDVTGFAKFPKANANPMPSEAGDAANMLAADDAQAALDLVRKHSREWNIDPQKVGYLGFSAGGGVALAATIRAKGDQLPSFMCTAYGPSLIEVDVPQPTPPLLIMTRAEHPNVAAGCLGLFLEWKKAGGNAEMHMYSDGTGPFALMDQNGTTTTEQWSQDLLLWLQVKGFTKPLGHYVVDGGGTGAYPAVVCREPQVPDFTIYRPQDMKHTVEKEGKPLPVVLFANGGCSYTSKGFKRYLTEIASHGYVVAAVGQYEEIPDSLEWTMGMTDSEYQLHGLDVLQRLNNDPNSSYYQMLDMNKVAAMGQSCGGGQALTISLDSRITTTVALNSGITDMKPPFPIEEPGSKRPADGPKDGWAKSVAEGGTMGTNFGGTMHTDGLQKLHAPVLYLIGGPEDVAYPNAKNNVELINHVPVSFASIPVGHGGTYAEPHGGVFADVTLKWLDWRLKSKEECMRFFADKEYQKTWFSEWEIVRKNW